MAGGDLATDLERAEDVLARIRRRVARPATSPEEILDAVRALHAVRSGIAEHETELIAAARAAGVSWGELAPALGVASRQAAERRYLRLQTAAHDGATAADRIQAERDRRAGDRAGEDWARDNAALVRQLAGEVGALSGLGEAARAPVSALRSALGHDDPAVLLGPLAAMRPYLRAEHRALARRLDALGRAAGAAAHARRAGPRERNKTG